MTVCIGMLSGLLLAFPFCLVSTLVRVPEGDFFVAKLLFPFPILLRPSLAGTGGHWLVGIAQWPVYGALVGWFGVDGPAKAVKAAVVLLVIHVLAVVLCLSGGVPGVT